MGTDLRPVLLITGIVSPYRREPFRLLAEDQGVEVAAFEDAGPPVPGLAVHRTTQAGAVQLAGSGRYRAVICGLGGRVALPGSYLAARRRGVPFVLWATLWTHPRTPAHALSLLPTRHLYRHADAVMTYGDHVSRHVEAVRGTRGRVFVAPQAVDVEHYAAPVDPEARGAARARADAGEGPLVLFVGRLEEEKGVRVLLEAWGRAALGRRRSACAGGSRAARGRPRRPRTRRPGAWLRWRIRLAGALRGCRHARRAVHPNRNFQRAVGVGR